MKRPLVRSVPMELILTGFHWETVREEYFLKYGQFAKAQDCKHLRALYKQRLWQECGIEVTL
jgi:hypothetical protein